MKKNGFVFLENLETAIAQKREECAFPIDFNMFVYNDNLKCLVFMGYYNPDYTNKDAMSIINNWEDFLETYFSDVYDFTEIGSIQSQNPPLIVQNDVQRY